MISNTGALCSSASRRVLHGGKQKKHVEPQVPSGIEVFLGALGKHALANVQLVLSCSVFSDLAMEKAEKMKKVTREPTMCEMLGMAGDFSHFNKACRVGRRHSEPSNLLSCAGFWIRWDMSWTDSGASAFVPVVW